MQSKLPMHISPRCGARTRCGSPAGRRRCRTAAVGCMGGRQARRRLTKMCSSADATPARRSPDGMRSRRLYAPCGRWPPNRESRRRYRPRRPSSAPAPAARPWWATLDGKEAVGPSACLVHRSSRSGSIDDLSVAACPKARKRYGSPRAFRDENNNLRNSSCPSALPRSRNAK
jgi:hypothetical protein